MEAFEKKEALVCVIAPVYNVAPWLGRFVESVLAQSWTGWELLLIDDGSTDGSGALCDAYAEAHENIQVFHQDNKGVSAARNLGLEHARGDFVLFADPDDWLAPEMLAGMLTAGRGAELTVCGFTVVTVGADGAERREEKRIWTEHSAPFESADVSYEVLVRTGMMCNKLFRRDVINALRFDEALRYGEDTVFVAQALGHVHTAVLIPEPWYFYYKNRPGNVVSAAPDERSLELLENAVRVYRLLRDRGEGPCGVRRIVLVVQDTFDRIPADRGLRCLPYIAACGRALRKAEAADRRGCARDERLIVRRAYAGVLYLETWCPLLGFYTRKLLKAIKK